MLHFIKSTLFSLDLRVACPNWVSLALYKCNDRANVTLELCVAIFAYREKQTAFVGRTPSQREEENKAELEKDKRQTELSEPLHPAVPNGRATSTL